MTEAVTTPSRQLAAGGLILGAVGIVVLWASGVDFPPVPPGLVIQIVGAGLVLMVRRAWTAALALAIALFLLVGFVVSGSASHLTGSDQSLGIVVGTWIQLVGLLTGLTAGAAATMTSLRKPRY